MTSSITYARHNLSRDQPHPAVEIERIKDSLEKLAPVAGAATAVLGPLLDQLEHLQAGSDEFSAHAEKFAQEFWNQINHTSELVSEFAKHDEEIAVLEGRLDPLTLRMRNVELADEEMLEVTQELKQLVNELQAQVIAQGARLGHVEREKTFVLKWVGDEPDIKFGFNNRLMVHVQALDGTYFGINLARVENAQSKKGLPSYVWDVPQAPGKTRVQLKGKVIAIKQSFTLRYPDDLLKRLCKAYETGRLVQLQVKTLPTLVLAAPLDGFESKPDLRVVNG